jgi:hypothetical protein
MKGERGMLTREQRNQLYLEVRDKELRLIQLAEMVGVTGGMLSKYFCHKANLLPHKEQKLIDHIHAAKRYELKRVEVK